MAYAIVETENRETWCWFLELLKEVVGRDLQQNPWYILYDRHKVKVFFFMNVHYIYAVIYATNDLTFMLCFMCKGLVNAIQEVLPICSHRNCCHHILQNFQKKFRQTGLGDLFWEAAKAPNVQEFLTAMNKIRLENRAAFDWLTMLDSRSWAFHAMEVNVKCEHVTSNFVESFNAWINEER